MNDWAGKRVIILGVARQGTALALYLLRQGAHVVLNDRRPLEALREVQQAFANLPALEKQRLEWVCGGHPLTLLDGADFVSVTGGAPLTLPLIVEAQRRGIRLTNDSQVFLEIAPCKVIGITGSAGKTTTTTLVGRMAGQRGWVGGNIGSPLISDVERMQPQDLAVMELSSFQLEVMTRSPQVAAVLNITPNHLDRHGSMPAYTAAKANILAFQSGTDIAVLNREEAGSLGLAGGVRGRLMTFGRTLPQGVDGTFVQAEAIYLLQKGQSVRVMSISAIRLRGEHNLLNVLAACAIAAAAGLPVDAMQEGVKGFTGVAHRLEFVRNWGGADWYNDSIATAPERSMAAIRAFDEPGGVRRKIVLLAGGRDKDLPWGDFAALVRQRVAHLVIFGEAAGKIAGVMGDAYPLLRCKHLAEAVQAAAGIVQPGDVVLLSPGGTSFDEFRDFEERGECFRQLVMHL